MFSEDINYAHINVLAYNDSDSFHWLRAPERIQLKLAARGVDPGGPNILLNGPCINRALQ